MQNFKTKKLFYGILMILVVFATLCSSFFGASANASENQNINLAEDAKISVMGEASIKVDPDQAKIFLTIQNVDTDAEVSKQLTLQMYENAINKLAEMGLEKNQISMSYFRTYPSYDYKECRSLIGYYAVLNFSVVVSDLQNVNSIIDELFSLGITTIDHINYEVTDISEAYNELLIQALNNAENKAKILLNKENVVLVKFIEENTYNCVSVYRNYADSSIEADLSSQIELTARVNATFE